MCECLGSRRWGHFDDLGPTLDGLAAPCRGFCSLHGPLQTVQRAELWGSFLLMLLSWVLITSMLYGMLVGCLMVFLPPPSLGT